LVGLPLGPSCRVRRADPSISGESEGTTLLLEDPFARVRHACPNAEDVDATEVLTLRAFGLGAGALLTSTAGYLTTFLSGTMTSCSRATRWRGM